MKDSCLNKAADYRLDFVVPGSLSTMTGGYHYDRRIINALRARGWTVSVHELDASFPTPSAAALADAQSRFSAFEDGAWVLVDGLAFGALPDLAETEANRLNLVALVHHPLALETGLTTRQAAQMWQAEQRALACAKRIVVTSTATIADLKRLGRTNTCCRVVAPATDPARLSSGSGNDTTNLFCVGSLTARKGHLDLITALGGLRDLNWQLACAGSTVRDPATAGLVRALIDQLQLSDRIELLGEVSDQALESHYHGADVFVLASHHEGYGMVFDEALAHGLPVVATQVGAIVQAVPERARLTAKPGDIRALSNALRLVITDQPRRVEMQNAARAASRMPRSWEQAGREFEAALMADLQ